MSARAMTHEEIDDESLAAIGRRIRLWRRQRGLTQTALAEQAGVGQGSISAYEGATREMSIVVALRIARALDLDIGSLVHTDP